VTRNPSWLRKARRASASATGRVRRSARKGWDATASTRQKGTKIIGAVAAVHAIAHPPPAPVPVQQQAHVGARATPQTAAAKRHRRQAPANPFREDVERGKKIKEADEALRRRPAPNRRQRRDRQKLDRGKPGDTSPTKGARTPRRPRPPRSNQGTGSSRRRKGRVRTKSPAERPASRQGRPGSRGVPAKQPQLGQQTQHGQRAPADRQGKPAGRGPDAKQPDPGRYVLPSGPAQQNRYAARQHRGADQQPPVQQQAGRSPYSTQNAQRHSNRRPDK
jgi:hypothetical protein